MDYILLVLRLWECLVMYPWCAWLVLYNPCHYCCLLHCCTGMFDPWSYLKVLWGYEAHPECRLYHWSHFDSHLCVLGSIVGIPDSFEGIGCASIGFPGGFVIGLFGLVVHCDRIW